MIEESQIWYIIGILNLCFAYVLSKNLNPHFLLNQDKGILGNPFISSRKPGTFPNWLIMITVKNFRHDNG